MQNGFIAQELANTLRATPKLRRPEWIHRIALAMSASSPVHLQHQKTRLTVRNGREAAKTGSQPQASSIMHRRISASRAQNLRF